MRNTRQWTSLRILCIYTQHSKSTLTDPHVTRLSQLEHVNSPEEAHRRVPKVAASRKQRQPESNALNLTDITFYLIYYI